MSNKESNSMGLGSTDLALMRLMLEQQRYPEVQAPAVTDLGSGINAAAHTIVNTLQQRQMMAQRQAELKQLLDFAQQQAVAEKEAEASKLNGQYGTLDSLGIPRSILNFGDGVISPVVSEALKQKGEMGNLQAIADNLAQQPWNFHVVVDKNGKPVMNPDGSPQVAQFASPQQILSSLTAGKFGGPYGQQVAEGMGKGAVAQYAQNSNDVNTPAGANIFHGYTGFQPENNDSFNQAHLKTIQDQIGTSLAARLFPYQAQIQGPISLQAGLQGLYNQAQAGQHQAMENQYYPINQGLDIHGKQTSNDQADLILGKDVARTQFGLQSIQNGSYLDPQQQPGIAYTIQTLGGGNPIEGVNQTVRAGMGGEPGASIAPALQQLQERMRQHQSGAGLSQNQPAPISRPVPGSPAAIAQQQAVLSADHSADAPIHNPLYFDSSGWFGRLFGR